MGDRRSKSTGSTTTPNYGRWIGITVAVTGVVFVAAVIVLASWGLLDRPESTERSDSINALLTLLGIVVAGAATLIGVLLRLSVQERSLAIRYSAESRQDSEQERLRAETALKAVDLLGKDHSEHQRGSALVTLCTIGQTPLALSLLNDLWSAGQVTAAAAVRVVEIGLQHEVEDEQRDAANLLERNAASLLDTDGVLSWPGPFFDGWDVSALFEVKASIVRARIKTWIEQPLSTRRKIEANSDIVMLYRGFMDESLSHSFKVSIALALVSALAAVYPKLEPVVHLSMGQETVRLIDVQNEVVEFLKTARRKDEPDTIPSILELLEEADPNWLTRLVAIEADQMSQ